MLIARLQQQQWLPQQVLQPILYRGVVQRPGRSGAEPATVGARVDPARLPAADAVAHAEG